MLTTIPVANEATASATIQNASSGFSCAICTTPFTDLRNYRIHVNTEHNNAIEEEVQVVGITDKPGKRLKRCDLCSFFFVGQQGLSTHRTKTHGITTQTQNSDDGSVSNSQPPPPQTDFDPITGTQTQHSLIEPQGVTGFHQTHHEGNTGPPGLEQPTGIQAEEEMDQQELGTLLTFFNIGLYTIHYRWRDLMRGVCVRLLENITSDMTTPARRDLNTVAFLLLPGLLRVLLDTKRPRPIDFLYACQLHTDPANFIIQQAKKSKGMVVSIRNNLAHKRVLRRHSAGGSARTSDAFFRKHRRRVERLFSEGRLGAACRVADQFGEVNPEVDNNISSMHASVATPPPPEPARIVDAAMLREIVSQLYPNANDMDILPPDEQDLPLDEYINITAEDVREVLRSLPRGSAHGATGWTNALLFRIFMHTTENQDNDLALLALLFRKLARNKIPSTFWLNGRVVPIPKTDGGIRPITIQDVIVRVLARTLVRKYSLDVGANLAPLQYGCGIRGGCEIVAKLAQLSLDAHPDYVLIKTDIKNAFQSIRLGAIYDGLSQHCKPLRSWFRWAYGNGSPLFDGNGEEIGRSESGCKQGDPLSPLLFCVAIHNMLLHLDQRINDIITLKRQTGQIGEHMYGRLFAYIDDLTVCVPYQVADEVFAEIQIYCMMYGLELNLQKCRVIGAASDNCAGFEPFQRKVEGDLVVGSPVGTQQYRRTTCCQVLEDQTRTIDWLLALDLSPQITYNLVKFCIIPRATYLCRVQEFEVVLEALVRFDKKIDDTIWKIVKSTPELHDEHARAKIATIRSLPTPLGGLGLHRFSWLQGEKMAIMCRALVSEHLRYAFAYDNPLMAAMDSWTPLTLGMRHSPMFPDDDPAMPPFTPPNAEEADENIAVSERRALEQIMQTQYLQAYTEIRSLLVQQNKLTSAGWWVSSKFAESGVWLTPPFGIAHDHRYLLTGEQFRFALRMRLLMPPRDGLGVTQCLCGHYTDFSMEPYHFLDCRKAARRTVRHNAVVHAVAMHIRNDCRLQDVQVTLNPRIPVVQVTRIADLKFKVGDEFKYLDAVISNPAAPTYNTATHKAFEIENTANNLAERTKVQDYLTFAADIVNGGNFIAFSAEATGRLSETSLKFIRDIGSQRPDEGIAISLNLRNKIARIINYFAATSMVQGLQNQALP